MLYMLECVEFTQDDIDENTATALWIERIKPTFDHSAEVSGRAAERRHPALPQGVVTCRRPAAGPCTRPLHWAQAHKVKG